MDQRISKWVSSVTLITVMLALPLGLAAAERPFTGRSLVEVLGEFRADGIPLIYSSSLVSPELRIKAEPSSGEVMDLIREILEPHGLMLSESEGLYLVIRSPDVSPPGTGPPGTASILVIIQNVDQLSPDAIVSIRASPFLPAQKNVTTGVFEIAPVTPGQYDLDITANGYLPVTRNVDISAGESQVVRLDFLLAPATLEILEVSTSRDVLLSNSRFFIDQRAIQALPDLGADPIRAVHRLPGAAASGLSSRAHFRGGEQNETAILLNGLQLLDPFHVRDYHGIFSAIDTRAISGVEAYTGGFPADYGDHMSGVLLLDSARPDRPLRTELGFSVYNSSLLSSGYTKNGQLDWLVSARRSNLGMFIKKDLGEPDYWDVFAELGWQLNDDTRLSVNTLVGKDNVTVITEADATELELSTSNTNNRHLWVVLDKQWTPALGSRTILSQSELENVRDSSVNDPDQYEGTALDIRDVDITGLRQEFNYAGFTDHSLRFGFEIRRQTARFEYRGFAEYQGFFALTPGIMSPRDIRVSSVPRGHSYSAWLLDSWTVTDRWSLEGGLRWDRQTYTEPVFDDQVSPRISLRHSLPSGTRLSLTWGRYFQPQAIQNLQVEDGLDQYFMPQRSNHLIAGLRQTFARNYRLRVEAFLKNYDQPKPRFENLYDNLALIPELEPDRVRLDPESARVRGVELSLEYRGPRGLDWWLSYTWSKATDRIDGRNQLRSWDQRHAVQAGLGWRRGPWEVGIAAHVHSGWPITGMTLGFDEEEDEYFPVAGERNTEKLNTFASLDFRVSRRFDVGLGELTAFVEITNATDRKNICCVDYDVDEDNDGNVFLDRTEDFWLPLIPAAGLLWEF